MSRRLRQVISKTPLLGHLARVVKDVFTLPGYQADQNKLLAKLRDDLAQAAEENVKRNNELADRYHALQTMQADIQKQLLVLGEYSPTTSKNSDTPKGKQLFADDHALDVFYASFEDHFRGSEEMIEERLKVYLPYFLDSKVNFAKTPVLDIGSGRGEFLRMLGKAKVNAMGLDINKDMVKRANDLGLKTQQGDALSFLDKAGSQSLGAITGFHIAEHIPFSGLYRIFKEAHRVLARGGFVIFETPNPENLVVSGHNFYMDPSHLHPLPPMLLKFTLENCGFSRVEIKRLHPDKPADGETLPKSVRERLFGPRDYAVIGYK